MTAAPGQAPAGDKKLSVGPVALLLDLVMMGDFVSLYLAAEADVDPGPVPVLELIKERLADG